ncbi:hypothetical protein Slala03_71990 [Streptomyces lavendulae subsp. lavendulae]|nr:hypothetical protein Slala03_71990 [Streptomyces lavendulae subsp. lavendulae]
MEILMRQPTGPAPCVGPSRWSRQARGGPVIEARPGDTVHTPPGEEHWHDAAPDAFMEHSALWAGPGPDGGPETCGATRSPARNAPHRASAPPRTDDEGHRLGQ